jgi:hypothetical protein
MSIEVSHETKARLAATVQHRECLSCIPERWGRSAGATSTPMLVEPGILGA